MFWVIALSLWNPCFVVGIICTVMSENPEIIYKKKKKKKICTVKPNAVTVFGTISLFQNHFIYFFLYHAPHMVFEIM